MQVAVAGILTIIYALVMMAVIVGVVGTLVTSGRGFLLKF